jgi:HK97 family phage major capsid protein
MNLKKFLDAVNTASARVTEIAAQIDAHFDAGEMEQAVKMRDQLDAAKLDYEKANQLYLSMLNATSDNGADPAQRLMTGVQVIEDEADRAAKGNPFRTLGEQLMAVKNAATGRGVDQRLHAINQLGMNEGIPSEGGFLVQQDFGNQLLDSAFETGVLASRIRMTPISANANGLKLNLVAETSRVNGSRWGGVQMFWIGEAGLKTPSMPTFRQAVWDLKKLIGLYYSTDELLQDASATNSIVDEAFREELGYMIDSAIFSGLGGGQPLGILPSPAVVAVPRFGGAGTISHEDVVAMWSRMVARSRKNAIWVYNQDCEPQIFSMGLVVGAGGTASFMPPGGLSGSPYATLMGRPMIPLEQASTLGTLGDFGLIDPTQYRGIDKGGVQTASSIHVAFLTDQTAFRIVYRFDGQPMWVAPLTPASGSANTLSPFVFLAA